MIVLPTKRQIIFRVWRGSVNLLLVAVMLFFLLLRAMLPWYADSRLRIPRFHLREHALRAKVAFFLTPEIKE
jgi:hypothetical protein